MKCSLQYLIFLKGSLVLPILLFSSISLHWSQRKAFLSLLPILWNSAFKWVYLSFSPLLFTSLLFTGICKPSSDSHFSFLRFFFLGMVLIPVSCTMSRTSVHSSSGPLSNRSRNQIDYILCSQRWRRSIQSAKTRPGADCCSDHELLIAKFRFKLKEVGKITKPFSMT